jgi:hypothetical protein
MQHRNIGIIKDKHEKVMQDKMRHSTNLTNSYRTAARMNEIQHKINFNSL